MNQLLECERVSREASHRGRDPNNNTLIVVETQVVTAAMSDHVDTPVRTSSTSATVAVAICIMPRDHRTIPQTRSRTLD
jgi:hypothetical protein